MKVGISKNENAYIWQALYFSFFKTPNLGGRNFLAHNVLFNYTMRIGAGYYVGLMASNLVENMKHMINEQKFFRQSVYQSKMYITTSPKETIKNPTNFHFRSPFRRSSPFLIWYASCDKRGFGNFKYPPCGLWFGLLGGSFVFLDMGPSILFLVFLFFFCCGCFGLFMIGKVSSL